MAQPHVWRTGHDPDIVEKSRVLVEECCALLRNPLGTVDAHSGLIWTEATPLGGTTVFVSL